MLRQAARFLRPKSLSGSHFVTHGKQTLSIGYCVRQQDQTCEHSGSAKWRTASKLGVSSRHSKSRTSPTWSRDQQTFNSVSGADDMAGAPGVVERIFRTEVFERENCDWSKVDKSLRNKMWPNKVLKLLESAQDLSESVKQDKAFSLLQYLRQTGKLGVASIGLLMVILAGNDFNSSKYENTVLDLYQELRARTDVYSIEIAKWVTRSLCKTRKWKESKRLVDDNIEFRELYRFVAEAAFNAGEPDLGYELLTKCSHQPDDPTFLLRLFLNPQNRRSEKTMHTILNFMLEQDVFPSKELAEVMADWFCR